MFDNFTDSTKELIYGAQNIAIENHNTLIEPVHILYSMVNSSIESVSMLFVELKLNSNVFGADVKNVINTLARVESISEKIYFSSDCLKLFELANSKAKNLKDKFVSPEHILLALTESTNNDLKRIIDKYQITENKILTAMKNIRGDKKVDTKNADENYKIIEKYSIDLTKLAREGKLDPVIGRDEEIRRIIQVLNRRSKNNPCLIGEANYGIYLYSF